MVANINNFMNIILKNKILLPRFFLLSFHMVDN